LELLRGFFRWLRKFANINASPTLEVHVIEPYHSTEYGQLYVAHCGSRHWPTMLRLQFLRAKNVEALEFRQLIRKIIVSNHR
jgi:hypothetical protein